MADSAAGAQSDASPGLIALAGTVAQKARRPSGGHPRHLLGCGAAAVFGSGKKSIHRLLPDELLHEYANAAKNGDVQVLGTILGKPASGTSRADLAEGGSKKDLGVSINTRVKGERDATALLLAAANGRVKAVTFLLAQGASLASVTARPVVERDHLINGKGTTVRAPGYVGAETALHLAALNGHGTVAALLIDHKADINQPNAMGATALHVAAKAGHARTLEVLLKRGARLDIITEMPQVLRTINLGGDDDSASLAVGTVSTTGTEAVQDAIAQHKKQKDHKKRTPHQQGDATGRQQESKVMVPSGTGGDSALTLAAHGGDFRCVQMLLKANAAVDHVNADGDSPLIKAAAVDIARHGQQSVAFLLKHGANPNKVNQDGNTPLLLAAVTGNVKSVILLLDSGADINTTNKYGYSALMEAAKRGHKKVVALLLKRKANKGLKNLAHCTAVALASRGGRTGCLQLLIDAKANVNVQSNMGITPLMESAAGGHLETVKFLLEHGASVDTVTISNGWTAIVHAASGGHVDVVRALLACGAVTFIEAPAPHSLDGDKDKSTKHHRAGVGSMGSPSPVGGCLLMQAAHDSNNATLLELLRANTCETRPSNASADELRWGSEPESYRSAYKWIAKTILNKNIDPAFVKSMLTMIANSHTWSRREGKESEAIQCLRAIAAKAKRKLLLLPNELHEAAVASGVALGISPRFTVTGRGLCQRDYLAVLQPEAQEVAATLVQFYGERRQEAVQELRLHNEPTRHCYGKPPRVLPLLTNLELSLAAVCLVQRFLYEYLVKNKPGLLQQQNGTMQLLEPKSLHQVRTFAASLGNDEDKLWMGVFDSLQLVYTSDSQDHHRVLIQSIMGSSSERTPINSGRKNSGNSGKTLQQQRGSANNTNRSRMGDREMTVLHCESTMDVPTALVKYERWVMEYRPSGLKYSDLIGGVKQAEKDRHELFGDIGSDPRDSNAARRSTFTKPMNGAFANAMEAAAKANPEVSAYAWSAALELLSTKVLADKQVSIGIELSCYLDQFYQYREVSESYQMIARAPSLAYLARECHQYNNNPAMAFDVSEAMTLEEVVPVSSPPKHNAGTSNATTTATRRSPTKKKQPELEPLTHLAGRARAGKETGPTKYGKRQTKPKPRQKPFYSGQQLSYLASRPT